MEEFKKYALGINQKIDKLRTERGMTVYKLSQETSISAQTIHNWFEQGTVPTLKNIYEVCHALGLTLADLFATGSMVELTSEKKTLHDDWCSLSSSEQAAVKAIVKSYKDKK